MIAMSFISVVRSYLHIIEGKMSRSNIQNAEVSSFYTPGIYADGYIVFVFPFVRSYVRTSVTFVEFASKFCVKVSQVVYISATTYQKAFIFGP